MPWHEKDDTIDWQAYFHRRNRIVAALLHSPYDHGGKLVQESLETQVRHLLSMQYVAGRDGPDGDRGHPRRSERMHRDVLHRLPELNKMRKEYTDSQAKPEPRPVPCAPGGASRLVGARCPGAPKSKIGFVKTFAASVVRQALPVRELSREYPEANVAHLDLKWWLLAQYDSALVSSADGTSASWYKRDPDQVRDLAKRSLALHARLAKEWPALSKQYKDALPDLVSPEDVGGVVRRVQQAAVLRPAGEVAPLLSAIVVARLRAALVASDFTVAAVAELIGPHAHAALGRNETTPALRRTSDGSALVDPRHVSGCCRHRLQAGAVERALPGLVDALCVAGLLERSVGEVRAVARCPAVRR